MRLLRDPFLFSYVIMVLYLCNAVRLCYAKMYFDMWYWLSALSITASVTFRNH